MSALTFRALTRADEPRMHAINRACPIEADFRFFFERTPSFFAWPDAVFDEYAYVGGFRGEELVGYALFAAARGHAGPFGARFSYVGDARVLPDARGHAFVEGATRALLAVVSPAPAGFTLIKRGNRAAREVAASMSLGDVEVAPLCGFDAANLLLLRRAGGARRFRVRRARPDDLPRLADLMARAFDGRLFAPLVTPDELARDAARLPGFELDRYYLAFAGDELVGALGAWDADRVRRLRVLRLSWRAELLRAAYQAARCAFRSAAPLPRGGQDFRLVTTTRVAVPSGDPDILRDLLATVHDDHLGGGFHAIVAGFTDDDPLARALHGRLVQHFRSDLFLLAPSANVPALRAVRRPYIDLRFI